MKWEFEMKESQLGYLQNSFDEKQPNRGHPEKTWMQWVWIGKIGQKERSDENVLNLERDETESLQSGWQKKADK